MPILADYIRDLRQSQRLKRARRSDFSALDLLTRQNAAAIAYLAQFDQTVASLPRVGTETLAALRARSGILALSETLTQYRAYFEGGSAR